MLAASNPKGLKKEKICVCFNKNCNIDVLEWNRFFLMEFGIVPKLIFSNRTHVLIFLRSVDYLDGVKKWHFYLRTALSRCQRHVRLIKYSSDLASLIANWFVHIKDLNIGIFLSDMIYEIILSCSPHLRQFLIGTNGQELQLLVEFLNLSTRMKERFSVKIK